MSVKFNYAQKDIIDSLYHAKSFLGDWNAALQVTQTSLAVAKGNMGDAAAVGGQLGIVVNDFADKTKDLNPQIQHFGDLMAYVARNGAFLNVNQLNEALSISIGASKAAGMSYEDTLATLNAFQAVGLQGSEAGSALVETLAAFGKGKLQSEMGVALATLANGSLDVIGTLVNLRKEVGSGAISMEQFLRASKALGIRGERALTVDVDALQKTRETLNSPIVNGAAMTGATIMLTAFNEQVGILGKKLDVIKDALGEKLLGPIEKIGAFLGPAIDRLALFAQFHPGIVKFAVYFAAASAALLVLVGGLALLVSGLAFLGTVLIPVAAFLGISVGWLVAIPATIAAILAAMAAWDPALLGKLLLPFKDFGLVLVNLAKMVYDFFTGQWGRMFSDAGLNAMKYLAK